MSYALGGVLSIVVGACSAADEAEEPDAPPASGGVGGTSGMTGGVGGMSGGGGSGGSGGAAGLGGAGGEVPIDDPLVAHFEDGEGTPITMLALECADDCVELRVVASGGHAPYAFEWANGSTESTLELCFADDSELSVTVTDTAIVNPEFPVEAQSVTLELSADVIDTCDGTDPPPRTCEDEAPAGSFDPVVKWTWNEAGQGSLHTPLVANLTDDNDDGAIDLDDIPDVVLAANEDVIVLDGAMGVEHFRLTDFGGFVGNGSTTPALGDIDGDGLIEILALDLTNHLSAFHHDGEPMWTGDVVRSGTCSSLSIADLDHDGVPEIIGGVAVYDAADGTLEWSASAPSDITAPTAADLDDDGFMEVTWGHIAYRHDGALYYENADVLAGGGRQFPAIADLDGDELPEVVVATGSTLFVLDHAGTTLRMTIVGSGTGFPPAIHDLDGDGDPEIMVSDGTNFRAFSGELTPLWAMPVQDFSSDAAGTAFDFLGDGTAEAMYGDETHSWGFDGVTGEVIFMQPRTSGTLIEYPTIADVDNDGSADMLITSDRYGGDTIPILQVISDSMNRWIPARRLMNQDTYHVTNINDDGSIPLNEAPHWKRNNSFRTQVQVDADGQVCIPKAEVE